MDIDIRRLTPAFLNDYINFFETDAHSDNPNEDRCYCVGWCSADHHSDMGFYSPEKRRETAVQYINEGLIQGYLAYIDGKVVGWCNANTKSECTNCDGWLRFKTAVNINESGSDSKVKSIFCFTIAPEMKRKGIAFKLLERVCRDAAEEGFEFVEAYPEQRFVDTFSAMGGPLELYKRNGFTICQEVNDKYKGIYDLKYYVVRKPLKESVYKTSVIGSTEVKSVVSANMDKGSIHKTNSLFWDTKGNEILGATALPFYGAFVSEENHRLFGDISGKKVLEIGCGSGKSLQYQGERGASELWAVDISEKQIEKTTQHLAAFGLSAKLICSPMEEECGIPTDYFDFVYSIYAIGWTTDLYKTFCRIASYLKKSGVFIFSWSHPIHKCVALENEKLTFKKCYFDESWYSVSLDGSELTLSDKKLSTYINTLIKAGFVIEQLVEESDDDILNSRNENDEFVKKAKMLPTTFIIKAKKP